jgi:putative SOS response-associated peptidase YedK
MCYTVSAYYTQAESALQNTAISDLFSQGRVSAMRDERPVLGVVTAENAGIEPMLWGLVPAWNKSIDESWRRKMANATVERLNSSPAFKPSFIYRRGAVLVRSFFEWRHEGRKKIPYEIFRSDGKDMLLGAIWADNSCLDLRSFSVVTVPANPTMAFIHNTKQRMPLVLEQGTALQHWLHGSPSQALQQALPANEGILIGKIDGGHQTRLEFEF